MGWILAFISRRSASSTTAHWIIYPQIKPPNLKHNWQSESLVQSFSCLQFGGGDHSDGVWEGEPSFHLKVSVIHTMRICILVGYLDTSNDLKMWNNWNWQNLTRMFLVQSVKVGGFLSPMSPDYGLRDTRVTCFVIPGLIQQTCFQPAPPQDICHLFSFLANIFSW